SLPESGRPHEGVVVEAGDENGRQQRVDRPDIEAERRQAILTVGFQAIEELHHGCPRIRLAARAGAQLHQRIGLLRAGGQDPPWPMVFERAAYQPDTRCEQRRSQRVTWMSAVALAVEREGDGTVSPDGPLPVQSVGSHERGVSPASCTASIA